MGLGIDGEPAGLDAAEVQQVLDEVGHAPRGAEYRLDGLLPRRRACWHLLQEGRRHRDRVERVAKVVGDDGHEVLPVVHGLPRLVVEAARLGIRVPLGGDVAGDHDGADHASLGANGCRDRTQDDLAAGPALLEQELLLRGVASERAGKRPLLGRDGIARIQPAEVQELGERGPHLVDVVDGLGSEEPEGGLVGLLDAARVAHQDGVRNALDDRGELGRAPLRGLAQQVLRDAGRRPLAEGEEESLVLIREIRGRARADRRHPEHAVAVAERDSVERAERPPAEPDRPARGAAAGQELRAAGGGDASDGALPDRDPESAAQVLLQSGRRPYHQVVAVPEQDRCRLDGGRRLDEHLQEPLKELVHVAALEGGRGDAIEGPHRPVPGLRVPLDGCGDRAVDGAVEEAHLLPGRPRGAQLVPDLQDAIAQHRQLDHDLVEVESFGEALDGVLAGGDVGQARPRIDDPVLAGVGDRLDEVGDVVGELFEGQSAGSGAGAHDRVPALEDLLLVVPQELGEDGFVELDAHEHTLLPRVPRKARAGRRS